MCFSASANFVASAAIGAVGVATLRRAPSPRAVLLAAVPLLFALHQFIEAFVWLGLEGRIGEVALGNAGFLYMLYAQGMLPFLMPLAVLLIEPAGPRWWIVVACTALGAATAAWTTYAVTAETTRVFIAHHSIVYRNDLTDAGGWIGAAYIAATCGALLASSHRMVRWFGLANVVGLSIVMLVKGYAFTSVWCLYAALVSVMLYWQFSRGKPPLEAAHS